MIMYASAGNQPATPCFPARPSNLSVIGAVGNKRRKLLQYVFTLRYYKTSVWCAKGYMENKNKELLTYMFMIDII